MNIHDFRYEVFRRMSRELFACSIDEETIRVGGKTPLVLIRFKKEKLSSGEEKLVVTFANDDGRFVFDVKKLDPAHVSRVIVEYIGGALGLNPERGCQNDVADACAFAGGAQLNKPLGRGWGEHGNMYLFEGGECMQLDDYAPAWFAASREDWQIAIANEMVCYRQGKTKIDGAERIVIVVDGDVFAVEERKLRLMVMS